jgi:lysophospholipid acyltransferase (LPLAT)-like uncharacterized protein
VKKLLSLQAVRSMLALLASLYIRFVYMTTRWEIVGKDWLEQYANHDTPFILCFWHSRLLMGPYFWHGRTEPFNMLISAHQDGQLIAQVISHFGLNTIHGSSSNGGFAATRLLLQKLKQGTYVGITPDGPRGPRQRINGNVIGIAQKANVDILPATYATSNRIIFKSWDRFHFPLPFGRGIFIFGPIVAVSRGRRSLEEWHTHLETVMNHQIAQADTAMGHDPILPAEPTISQGTVKDPST